MEDFLQYNQDEPIGNVSLLWDVQLAYPKYDDKFFLVNAMKVSEGDVYTFKVDHLTTPIPVNKGPSGPIRVLELFAGGYGGWSAACHFLSDMHGASFHTVAVERDVEAAFSYAISRNAQMWNGNMTLPLHALQNTKQDVVLCADVHCLSWVPTVACWSPQVLCISSSCQPWSSAGNGQGLCSEDGECMMQSIAIAKLLRPKYMLLEQVAAFMSHPHKKHVLSLLRWAGYSLIWNKIVNLAEQCPTQRNRWLALAVRIADHDGSVPTFQYWKIRENVVPLTYGSILPMDLTLDERLQLNEAIIRLASKPDLLPAAKRRCVLPENTLQSRCYHANQVLPTFMAAYGHQHEFSEAWLAGKGLMCHFLQHDGKMRMWHPIEVLLHHGVCTTQFVHHDWKLAWQHSGNQIAVPHALLLLTNMMRLMFPNDLCWNVDDVMDCFSKSHHTADVTCIVQCAKGQIISKEALGWSPERFDNIDAFHSCLIDGNLPPNLRGALMACFLLRIRFQV